MSTAYVNGHLCHYAIFGDGPPLLYMHGGFGGSSAAGVPASTESWVDAIAEHFQLITYDRRSAGKSSAPKTEHTLDVFAADAVALLDALGIKSAAVWGQSAGCAIALTFALAHPDRVDALVLTDGAPWFTRDEDIERRLRNRIRILETEGATAAYDARRVDGGVGLQMFGGVEHEPTDEERAKLARQRDEMRARLANRTPEERIELYAAELRTQKAYLSFDASQQLSELRMPVLVMHGTDDRIFPDVPWSAYAEAIPNLTFRALQGAAHGCGRSPEAIDTMIAFFVGCGTELDTNHGT